jgi:hypothetical protein
MALAAQHLPVTHFSVLLLQTCIYYVQETLINSEFPQHMDVLPFSMADKPLKMKNKIKSH